MKSYKEGTYSLPLFFCLLTENNQLQCRNLLNLHRDTLHDKLWLIAHLVFCKGLIQSCRMNRYPYHSLKRTNTVLQIICSSNSNSLNSECRHFGRWFVVSTNYQYRFKLIIQYNKILTRRLTINYNTKMHQNNYIYS